MEIYGKSLIFVVFILIILSISQFLINRYTPNNIENVENFEEMVYNTIITKLDPYEGDSSTIVTIEGGGLNNVGKILFNNVECAILENRSDSKIEIIPPSLSELEFNISDVRKSMKEKNEGLKVKISIARRDVNTLNITGNSPEDTKNVVEIQGVNFFYIDRIPYQNNCPEPPRPPPPPAIEPVEIELVDNQEVEYAKGSDLEFIQKILPKKEREIDSLIGKMNKVLEDNREHNTNDITYLNIIQSLDALQKYKKTMNIQRFNIHNTLHDRYGYNF